MNDVMLYSSAVSKRLTPASSAVRTMSSTVSWSQPGPKKLVPKLLPPMPTTDTSSSPILLRITSSSSAPHDVVPVADALATKPAGPGVPGVVPVAPLDGHAPCAHGGAAVGSVAPGGSPSS